MQIVKIIKRTFVLVLSLFCALGLKAQTTDALGTYTPYSLFGIGDIIKQGTAVNRGMGGIGIGVRDNRFINYINPASITERDTLSFMLDMGINQKNYYNSDGKVKSAYNTFNLQNVIFTAPIYKKSALIVGITPFSNIGYKFESTETDNALVAKYGDIKYQKYGEGSINQFFVGAAFNLFKKFSLGAEYIYYFGAMNKYSNILFNTDATLRNLNNGWDYGVSAHSGKLGLQYFTKIGKNLDLTVGATYRFKSNLKGDLTRFSIASQGSYKDTIVYDVYNNPQMNIPGEIGLGVSFKKKDKWMLGFDYMRQDWSNSKLLDVIGVNFSPMAADNFNLGFEYIPNKYDIRYYMKRVTYRAGLYYEESYLKINNKQVNSFGVTLGMSLPIYKWYNAINLAVDFGQRGSLQNQLVRERYIKFLINISLHDIWFVKHRYQ